MSSAGAVHGVAEGRALGAQLKLVQGKID